MENNIKLFGLPAEKGRWFIIPLGVIILLCLGTVYSWSIFRTPLEKLLNIKATESLLPFTILLVVFSILMPITGFYIDKFGVKTITAVGGIITGIGYISSGLMSSNITNLIITYGIIAGAGVGIVYGMPIAVTARWFPDKKGLAVGLTVIGFGLSPLITVPISQILIKTQGILQTFIIFGIAFTIIIVGSSALLEMPPKGWKPANWQPNITATSDNKTEENILQSPNFYSLWICYIIGTFVGLSAIGISKQVGQEIIHLDKEIAGMTVSLFAIFNGLGRPLFGWITDKVKPKNSAIISYVIIIIASILMLSASKGQVATYIIAFCLFWLCLGGWLAIAPTVTLTLFSPENYAKNYGIVFTAYGVGALFGTIIAGQIKDGFGSYINYFYVTGGLAIVGIILAVFTLKNK